MSPGPDIRVLSVIQEPMCAKSFVQTQSYAQHVGHSHFFSFCFVLAKYPVGKKVRELFCFIQIYCTILI